MGCSVPGCPRPRWARGWCGTHYQRWRVWGTPEPDGIWERFIRLVDAEGDCWTWLGVRTGNGYGRYQAEGHYMAHRFIWSRLVGPIPEGLTLDHLCRNRACVNPDHLEMVTSRENLLRGQTLAAQNAAKTHCKHGHEFTEANTYRHGPGKRHRMCRTCMRRLGAEHDKRRRGKG